MFIYSFTYIWMSHNMILSYLYLHIPNYVFFAKYSGTLLLRRRGLRAFWWHVITYPCMGLISLWIFRQRCCTTGANFLCLKNWSRRPLPTSAYITMTCHDWGIGNHRQHYWLLKTYHTWESLHQCIPFGYQCNTNIATYWVNFCNENHHNLDVQWNFYPASYTIRRCW